MQLSELDLDAFSSGQMQSKIWLVENLEKVLTKPPEAGYRIWILGGWYGLTNTILRIRNNIPIQHVRSFDIDQTACFLADKINSLWEWKQWQFKSIVQDVNELKYELYDENFPHVVINTSVEHMEDREWFNNIPTRTLIVLQANNMQHDDHCKLYSHEDELIEEFPMSRIVFADRIHFDYGEWKFDRYMIMGYK